MDWLALLTSAMVLGLFSTPHCVGMCGGLAASLAMQVEADTWQQKLWLSLQHNLGRFVSYSLLGLLAGSLGMTMTHYLPASVVGLRVFAGLLIILAGLYIGHWWSGIRYFEQGLFAIWQWLRGWLLPHRPHGLKGRVLFAGMLWGCLPCGLVYSALAVAMTQAKPWLGALYMLGFGLGTLPVLLSIGFFGAAVTSWLQKKWLRSGVGGSLICYGLWTVYFALMMQHSEHQHQHGYQPNSPQMEQVFSGYIALKSVF